MEKLAIRPGITSFRGKSKGKENDITQSWKRSFSIGILGFRNSEIGTWKLNFSIFFFRYSSLSLQGNPYKSIRDIRCVNWTF